MHPNNRNRRVLPRLVGATAVIAISLVTLSPAAAGQPLPEAVVTYRPPVVAPVLDPFRAPASPYGPGNRGIEYDTAPGQPVVASASGVVTFAGAVAGTRHVTIGHVDGVRTSYSFLASVEVTSGQRVEQGSPVGTAGDTFHFGARIGDVYVDPDLLFGSGPTEVALVPHDRPLPAPSGRELPLAVAAGRELPIPPGWFGPRPAGDVLATLAEWQRRRDSCTPPAEPVPAPTGGRRIAVLIGGLGSSTGQAAVTGLDTSALGFADGDVVRFSYAGGRVPGTGSAIDGIVSHDYEPADTLGDLRTAGRRLADLIDDLAHAVPDATIDLIGHSQGGVVGRLALDHLAARPDRAEVVERLGALVTIGASHQGADLATLVLAVRAVPGGASALELLQSAVGTPIEPDAPAVAQLAEGSELLTDLAARPPPPGVDVWSIAARGDLVVPAARARLAGATNVIVSVDGLVTEHVRLPAAPAVTREIGLALAGRAPTCEGALEALVDAMAGATISWVESAFGLVPVAGMGG
ncbi:MAG: peptidoglycan DD-metalloendopeptidase family protein [Acidimicrobiales bacterium]